MGNKPIRGGIREGYPTTSQLSLNSSFEWDQDTQSAVSSNGSSGSGSDFRSTSDNIDGELMEVPSAFEILFDDLIALEFIGSGRYAEVYKVLWVPKKGEVELEVAMKKLKTLFNPKEYVRVFKNEISVLGALQQRSSGHPNVINFIGCCTNPYLIVTELLVQSLHNALFKSSTVHTNLRTILKIALDVASGLEYLHQNNIIHRDLSSRNVMLDSDDLAKATAKVSDFGLSKLLEPQKLSNEVVDPRIERATDVYSFALILYQLISKLVQIEDKPSDIADIHLRGSDSSYRPLKSMDKVTFSSDPHQAAIQKMLIELMMDCWDQNPLARPTFTEIVVLLSDLIRKEANPSYVSEFAAIQRKRHNAVFSIPTDKAYGRDIEIATVKDIFKQHERGVKNVTRFILVAGPSGIGKSCFVRKVFADLEEMYFDNKESISFYSGKFDQFQSNSIPYSAIIDAIRQLITNKVVIPGKKNMLVRKKWKRTIKKIIGKNAALIAEVIPEIGAILASKKNKGSASAMDCSPDEAKTRFTQTFLGLLNVLSTPNHKLVLFIDDWQWADDATLNILPEILKNQNLIVIGAYRDNECPEGHPFLNMVSVVKKQANMRVHEIVLGAPSAAELNNICCDALRNHDDKQRTMPLAELIHKRTGGNPFFFAQFLSTLHMNNLIYFDPKSEKWQYDLEKITQQGFSGVIVDFMVSKLRMLSSKSRQILQLASCLGSTFHFSTLRVMCAHVKINDDNGTAKVIGDISVRDLHECIDNNYLQPASAYGGAISLSHNADVAYRFAHDKIQQAAFMLFAAPTSHSDRVLTTAADGSAADKTKDQPQTLEYVRVQIAQVLLDNTDLDQNPAAIFSIVSNFNLGRTILATLPGGPQKLIQLTRLNLRAAEQALKTGDYTSALHHARVAVEVLFDLAPRALFPSFTGNDQELKDRVWQDPEYKLLAIEVTLQAQQLEYYNKNIARGDEQFEIIKKFVTDETALARSFRHKTVQLELEMAYFEGLSVASEYFAKYCGDKDIPKDLRSVTLEQAKEVFYSVKKMAEDQGYIQFKDPEYLARSKAVPEIPIVSMFGAAIVPMMMTASVPGTIYVCSKAIEISLKRNIMKKAAFYACSVLAAIVPHVLGEFDCLCTMLENAYEYSEARYDPNFSFGYLVNARFWKHPIADCVHRLLNETLRISMEQGDRRNAEYAIIFASHLNSYVGPENLPDFFKKFSKYQDYCGSMGFKLAGLYITSSLSNMRVLDASNDSAEDDLLQFETAVIKPLPPYPKMYFYSQKALVYLVLGRSDKRDLYTALCSANNLIACTSPSYSSIAMLALIYFVDCMIRLALFNESEEQEQQEWRSIIEDRIEKLHIYARLHTDNFSHYYYLCLAQRARVLSMEPRGVCVEHYTTAISYARNNNFLWVAGLSAEFLAQYYTEIGDNNAFAQSLQEAYAFYKKWGATRKTSLMLQEYGSSVLKAELAGEEKMDSIDPSAVSELLQASAQGDIEKVLAAIKKLGAGNVNAKDQDKKSTAMHHAAAYGHVNVIRILAAHGANVNELDVLESTPLHYAAANGFPDAVDALCEAFLQNASNGGVTAMKAWLNQRNGYGYSALQVALANTSKSGAITTVTSLSPRRKAQQLAVAERLLSHGADINVKQSNSSTVLHEACVNGDLETVMFLLFQQQTNNNSGNDDETSNSSSRRRRSSSTANKKQPLKCRSNINISLRDRDNVTALQLAAKKSHSAIVQALVDFINAKFNVITTTDVAFDQAGFSALINSTIMVRGKDGHNMLHTAMARNDRETVTILMNTVSNGNASIHPGARQIWIASIFKMLNTKDVATGSTPLVLGLRAASAATSAPAAIEVAFLPALVSLVTANNSSSSNNNSNNISGELLAFLRTANSKGETPMGIALANGYSTIVTYLVKLGVPRDSPSSVINTAQ